MQLKIGFKHEGKVEEKETCNNKLHTNKHTIFYIKANNKQIRFIVSEPAS